MNLPSQLFDQMRSSNKLCYRPGFCGRVNSLDLPICVG